MFSALSKWILTAVGGSGESCSIVRIQQIIGAKLVDYIKLLPTKPAISFDGLEEAIYKLLLENGAFYHMQYNVRPTPHKLIKCEDVSLVRGLMPEEKACFSGLAPFVPYDTAEGNLADDFMLWPLSGSETIDLAWRRSLRVDSDVELEEYLNIERVSGRYFIGKRNPNWQFALARSRQSGNMYAHDYYILIGDEVRRIPTDYLEASVHDYVRLAMMNKVKKQAVTALIREHTVLIEFDYLLPAPDLRFMKYVSWPANAVDIKNDFRFLLQFSIWPGVKKRLTSLGYEVYENYD